jgi:hypothetical protein
VPRVGEGVRTVRAFVPSTNMRPVRRVHTNTVFTTC